MDKDLWAIAILYVIGMLALAFLGGCSTKWTSEGDLYKAVPVRTAYCPSSTVLYTAPGVAGIAMFVPCHKLNWRTKGWLDAGVEV